MSVSLADLARIGGVIHVATEVRDVGCDVQAKDLVSLFSGVERRFSVGGNRRSIEVRERILKALDEEVAARPGKDLTLEEASGYLWYAMNGPNAGDPLRRNFATQLAQHGWVGMMAYVSSGAFAVLTTGDRGPSPVDVAEATLAADKLSGAGYPVDRYIRLVLDDCVGRSLNGNDGFHDLPSAVAFEAFLQPKSFVRPDAPPFDSAQLRPERDHAFDLGDFMDVTAFDGIPDKGIGHLAKLERGTIHHFSPLVLKQSTLSDGKDTLVIGGFSCIRQGSLLHWFMIGGPIRDLATETAELRKVQIGLGHRVAQPMAAAGDLLGEPVVRTVAVALEGTDDVWKCVLWGVFDLNARVHLERGLTCEVGWTLDVNLDPDKPGADGPEIAGHVLSRLPMDLMTEAAETCFGLPGYFDAKVYHAVEERRPTRLSGNAVRPSSNNATEAAADDRKILVRVVKTLYALPRPDAEHGGTRKFTPPRYMVEFGGGYRTLRPGSVGKGPDGEPEFGRTWVRRHDRWRNQPKRPSVLCVKEPVMPALEKFADYEEVPEHSP